MKKKSEFPGCHEYRKELMNWSNVIRLWMVDRDISGLDVLLHFYDIECMCGWMSTCETSVECDTPLEPYNWHQTINLPSGANEGVKMTAAWKCFCSFQNLVLPVKTGRLFQLERKQATLCVLFGAWFISGSTCTKMQGN